METELKKNILLDLQITGKSYKTKGKQPLPVLGKINLQLKKGELNCLIGKSGCGKTTLLNILSGLDRNYSGQLLKAFDSLKIGYVFQEPCLLPWKTVRKNLELVTRKDHFSEIEKILEEFEIPEFIDAYPKELSLGMARRVAIARAFLYEPEIILLDEPFVSLDMKLVQQLQDLIISRWKKRDICILLVTHDIRQALKVGQKLIFLGKTPAEVVSEQKIAIPYEERDSVWIEEQFAGLRINRE